MRMRPDIPFRASFARRIFGDRYSRCDWLDRRVREVATLMPELVKAQREASFEAWQRAPAVPLADGSWARCPCCDGPLRESRELPGYLRCDPCGALWVREMVEMENGGGSSCC